MFIGGRCMSPTAIKDKHLKLDQKKIDRARRLLGVRTETEAIHRALDSVIERSAAGKPERKWAGALKTLRNKYTSVELQHELAELRLSGK
jgi:hypothetical protein